jgi:hypothetical protein
VFQPLKTPTENGSSSMRGFGLTSLLLVAILVVMFFRSFLPGEIVFSNDGPYGAISSAAGRLPSGFKGSWEDLNWFGSESVSASPDLSNGLAWLLQPLLFSKFYCPIAVFVVGLSAWVFLRQLGLAMMACVVAAIAVMLNSDFFSTAAWGVASQPICFGANFLALAAITRSSDKSRAGATSRHPWLWTIIAGFCVGWGVMEAFDIGAIFSMFTAAYVVFQSWNNETGAPNAQKFGLGIARVAVVTIAACFIAVQTLNVLIGTQIQGVAGTAQEKDTKKGQWKFATQWSVPKKEFLQILIPGVFGYRMDSPDGANYWGTIGQSPEIPDLVKARDQGPDEQTREAAARELAQNPNLTWRFSGSGFYAGVLVLIVACWAVCQSFRKKGSPFSQVQRRSIWFWLVVAISGVLLGLGKFAMFYRLFYSLPYVSTIRNPTKFMHVFSWALVILFAYGLDGLHRSYLKDPGGRGKKLFDWSRISGFDRKWLAALFGFVALSILGWGIYASSGRRSQLAAYIASVNFDAEFGRLIAGHSIAAVGWFVAFLVAATCVVLVMFSGALAGRRAPAAGLLLGSFVLLDLGRANLPWIVYWDVNYKYASNPIIDLLRDKPYEHRAVLLPYGSGQQLGILSSVYKIEWVQQIFPLYNIQCMDVIMEPRVPQDKVNFLTALPYGGAFNLRRTWELSNTRYLLGLRGMVDVLNHDVDPQEKRFRLLETFNFAAKPDAPRGPGLYPVDFTPIPATNGELAVIEFTGALPRAGLYSKWQVNTNDAETLKLLASPEFDPQKTVLVANPIPDPSPGSTDPSPGTVTIKPNYEPKRIELEADVTSASVLLLNDKYSPHWHAYVNGQPAELLRCNYIARGLYLKPGHYNISFRYEVQLALLYVSTLAVAIFLGLFLWLGLDERRSRQPVSVGTKRAKSIESPAESKAGKI